MKWSKALAVAVGGIVSVFLALGILSAAVGLFSLVLTWAAGIKALAFNSGGEREQMEPPRP